MAEDSNLLQHLEAVLKGQFADFGRKMDTKFDQQFRDQQSTFNKELDTKFDQQFRDQQSTFNKELDTKFDQQFRDQQSTFNKELDTKFDQLSGDVLQRLEAVLNDKLAEFEKKVDTKVDTTVDKLLRDQESSSNKKLDRLNKEYEKLNKITGTLVEQQFRSAIASMTGDPCAKSIKFCTLEDLAKYALESDVSTKAGAVAILDAAHELADVLIQSNVPALYAQALEAALRSAQPVDPALTALRDALEGPWFDEDGLVIASNMAKFLGKLPPDGDLPLRRQAGLLLQLLSASEASVQRAHLLKSAANGGSLGIVLAQYAVAASSYVRPAPARYSDICLASDTVECDIRGKIVLVQTTAVVEVGEIKRSSKGYGKGVDQLKKRLDLLEWAVRCLRPHINNFVRLGQLYIPKSESVDGQGSMNDGNTCICLHLL